MFIILKKCYYSKNITMLILKYINIVNNILIDVLNINDLVIQ